MTRAAHRGRTRGGLTAGTAAALLAAVLAAGCGTVPSAASGAVTVPSPAPPMTLAVPSGAPAPVPAADPLCSGTPLLDSASPISPMPSPGDMPAGSTMAAIEKRGYLLAGVDQNEYEWGYRNPAPTGPGNAYLGFDIDVLHALAYAIFGNADAIRFVPVTEDFRLGAANTGLLDVVADSVTMTCSREAQVRFSVDYIDSAQELLVPRGVNNVSVRTSPVVRIEGLRGKRVCTLGTTTSVANLNALARADGFSVILAENWSDCLVMLQQGQVQAFSTDASVLGGIEAEDPYLKLIGPSFSREPHGLAFPRSDPYSPGNEELVRFANGVILGLESRTDGGYCPEPQLPRDASCWAAMYRLWAEAQLTPGITPSPPTPHFSG
jgi:polar amino acid transport system substrate-binding protein